MKSYLFFAIAVVFAFVPASYGYGQQTAEQLYQSALYKEEIQGELDNAIKIYETIIKQYPENRSVAAKALLHSGICKERLGMKEAQKVYEQVLRDYADQAEPTKMARERLSALTGGAGGTATKSTEVVMRRIWVTDNINFYNPIAGISQDGRYIVLNKNGDLWLHDRQTERQKQITHEASWTDWSFAYGVGSAYLSPDEKWIVYCWSNGKYAELRLSAIDGSSMRVLHNGQDGRRMKISGWMPDGRQVLTVSFDQKVRSYQLHIISVEDNTIHDIGQPYHEESTIWLYACPSPDGRYIAYFREDDIYMFDTTTEQESIFVQNPAIDALAGWTPDGSGIVFVSDRSGTHDIYLLGIENGKPRGELRLLRRDFGANGCLSLTRDGKLFRIEQIGSGDSFIVPVDKQTGKPSGTPSQVDPSYPGIEGPMWSSDGKLFYYEIYRNLDNEQLLFSRSEETGQKREIILKPKLKFWYGPILSPDGRRFIITGTSEDVNLGFGVFTVNSESGDLSQLVKITENESGNVIDPCPNWSPDGKAIFYEVRSPEKGKGFIIRRKDLNTGEEKDIYHGLPTPGMKISPDGTRFAYFRTESPTKSYVLGILDINSGKELELWRVAESDAPSGTSTCSWTPDGKYILVTKDLSKGSELWRFPAAGGPGEKLYFYPEVSYGFVLHPNGDRMAYTQYRLNFELWVLENFLPK